LVPLVGPSRSLVKFGLEVFPQIKRFGIKHILKEAGIENKLITPYDIGFIIAPRINAVGRLENALDALRLLLTTNEDRAQKLAQKVGKTNRQRQDLVQKSVEEAKKQFKVQSAKFKTLPKIIILISDHWHEGIIGLIAAKVVEEYYRPTIILTKTDGTYKASARSIPVFILQIFYLV
jgi:single-stranded-DNA-specific exonuclease